MLTCHGLVRRWACICTMAAFAVLLSGCGGAQSRFASHMKRGEELFARADYVKASVEFRNALQIQPKSPDARLMAARAAEKLEKYREAAGLYRSLVDSDPNNVEARAGFAHLLAMGGAPQEAMKLIEPALKQHPDNAALLTWRATARMQLNDLPGASEDVDLALKLAPANADAIALRAGLYRQAGANDKALALVSTAVRAAPGSADLRQILVDLYMAVGDSAHAQEQLRALIALKPQEPRFRYQLVSFYMGAHQIDEAQGVLEAAVKALPQNDEVKLNFAQFVSAQRSAARGEKLLRDFVAHEPDNYALRLGLGALLQSSGQAAQAVTVYEEVIRRDDTGPNGLIARDRIAAVRFGENRYDESRKLVDQVLKRNPRDTDALLLRAQLGLQRGDPTAAVADLRVVLRDQPKSPNVRRLLARAYVASGQAALAEELLRAGVDLTPSDVAPRLQLAEFLVQTKRADQAVGVLEQALHVAPANPDILNALARTQLVRNDFVAARKTAEDLKAAHPDSGLGPYLAGLAAEGQRQLDAARKELLQAASMEPRNFDFLTALTRVDIALSQPGQAIAAAKNAIARDPSNPLSLNLLGQLYLQQKNYQEATDVLARATALAPLWWLPCHNLALARSAAGDTAGALAAYDAGIKALPGEPQLIVAMALLYEKLGRADEAIARYDDFYRRNPTAHIVANNLALLLVTHRNDQTSLDRARDLTATFGTSEDPRFLDTTGWVHFKRAEYAQALSVLQRASEKVPDSKEIRYHLGMAELRSGQTEQARTDLESALSGAPSFSGSDEARVELAALKNRAG